MAKEISHSEHPKSMQSLVDYVAAGGESSGWAIFTMMLATTNSIPIAKKLIECGLNLNTVYVTDRDSGHFSTGESTILDHVYGVQAYLSPKRKKLKELTASHAVRLSPRRKFIEEIIILLRSKGAMRASELMSES